VVIGRIPILDVQPVVQCGQYPAKAVVGEAVPVSATVFREGHEMLGASVVLQSPDGKALPPVVMREQVDGTDQYLAEVRPSCEGRWHFHIEAWGDPLAGWRHDAGIKVPIGQDVELMLLTGARLLERAAKQISAALKRAGRQPSGGQPSGEEHAGGQRRDERARMARAVLKAAAARLTDARIAPMDRLAVVTEPDVAEALAAYPVRDLITESASYPLIVHRQRALYGAWYEFFPRSEGARLAEPGHPETSRSGTLRTASARLDAVAAMGFDVVYVPPVHPIGSTARKGRNNTLKAGPSDPGSPWAIGSAEGGHYAIHPDLGSMADFDKFVARAGELGLEIAMDLALQASPDHPWLTEHPEWFTTRADGTIAYAENPPKKYQDIYPLNFDNDPDGIYAEMLALVRHWMSHGVRIFRVDNPHTKPLPFWQRMLAEIADTDPDVIFLAEAFTRPAMMRALACIGFHQSYTYFTWRNSRAEITEYMQELAGPASAYMRPNFFVNTPDIVSAYLQHAPPAAFRVRATLAAMLTPSWGVYCGYELCENVPFLPGSEEYLDSEKYAYKPRDWAVAAELGQTIAPFLARLNGIRRAHPALHELRNLRFHSPDQPEIICFSKSTGGQDAPGGAPAQPDTVLVVVNLDPHQAREATVWIDGSALGVDTEAGFTVIDELSGQAYRWSQANYVRLDPAVAPAHIFTVTR
jgi:starch synthase (maltosyl-transferring)